MTDLAIRDEIIRAYRIAWIDLSLWDELVDVDRTSGFEGDVFQLFLPDLDVRIGVDLESLHDIFGLDFLAGVGIDLEIIDPVACLAVDLIEADLLGIRCRRKQRDRAGDE